MAEKHALLSPSSASRWMQCPGSVAMQKGIPNTSNAYADEGTAAHELASWTLEDGVGQTFPYEGKKTKVGVEINYDMCEHIQNYVDTIMDFANGNTMFVEQKIDISHVTDETGAEGTADVVIITADGELQVHDLKYGMGVRVYPEHNEQLMVYALGALEQYKYIADIKHIRLVIHQPRLEYIGEWDLKVEELVEFGTLVSVQAKLALKLYSHSDTIASEFLNPSDDACKFCRAAGTCPALRNKVITTIVGEFDKLEEAVERLPAKIEEIKSGKVDNFELAVLMNLMPELDILSRATRGQVESELFKGHEVPGYKLVQGKQGNRKWEDKDIAEEAMKSMRLKLDEMYTMSIISPTQAEKLLEKNNPRKWKKLNTLITRSDGLPSVASENDKRPALIIKTASDEFAENDGEFSEFL